MSDLFENNFKRYFFHENLVVHLNNVLKMGRIVQGMFYKFKDAYFDKNKQLSEEIISQDDRLDYLEAKLELEGISLLTRGNYTGIYLKSNILGIKLINIFENMGDICEENAKLNLDLLTMPQKINMQSFEDIFIQANEMLSLSLRLLSDYINIDMQRLQSEKFRKDIFDTGKKICILDTEVNSLFSAYKKYLFKSKETSKAMYTHLEILSNLEKFCDFTTNITENIIWSLTGIKYKCRGQELEYFYSMEDDL
ncbi:MAG TPA: PhoU domain-containing protein [Tepiditoga sp.]|nr:hypothetical protein [Thermotogota bacterium]HOO73938.1 PhoU domain-containing protein [Tepiditoga sp.]